MAQIIFQGFNYIDHPMILSGKIRRIMGSQKIYCEIDNERALITFTIYPSDIPAEYLAKTIDMVMTDYIRENNPGSWMARNYFGHDDRLDHFIETIKNDKVYEF